MYGPHRTKGKQFELYVVKGNEKEKIETRAKEEWKICFQKPGH